MSRCPECSWENPLRESHCELCQHPLASPRRTPQPAPPTNLNRRESEAQASPLSQALAAFRAGALGEAELLDFCQVWSERTRAFLAEVIGPMLAEERRRLSSDPWAAGISENLVEGREQVRTALEEVTACLAGQPLAGLTSAVLHYQAGHEAFLQARELNLERRAKAAQALETAA